MKRPTLHPVVRWLAIVSGCAALAVGIALFAADRADKQAQAHLAQASLDELQSLTRLPDRNRDPMVFYWLGVRLSEAGRDKDAVLAFARAAILDAKSGRIRYSLGEALDRAGRPQEAEGQLKQAIGLEPRAPLPQYVLGKFYGKYGRWEEAVAYLKAAAELDPKDIEAPFLLALAYEELAKRTHAPYRESERALLESLAKRAPKDTHILKALASCYVFFNQVKEAEALYRRIAALDPNDLQTRALLGRSLAEQAETPQAFAEAENLLNECAAKDPKNPGVPLAQGILWSRRAAPQKAVPCLQRAIQQGATEPEAWFHLGRALAQSGRAAEAKQATETFARKERNRRTIRSLEMRLGFEAGEKEGQTQAQDGLRLELARVLMDEGRYSTALGHLRDLLTRDSSNSEALQRARECERRLKQQAASPTQTPERRAP